MGAFSSAASLAIMSSFATFTILALAAIQAEAAFRSSYSSGGHRGSSFGSSYIQPSVHRSSGYAQSHGSSYTRPVAHHSSTGYNTGSSYNSGSIYSSGSYRRSSSHVNSGYRTSHVSYNSAP